MGSVAGVYGHPCDALPGEGAAMADLERDLASLLNRYSQENGSNTPDFLLAEYLLACLSTWNTTVAKRDEWYGNLPSIAKHLGG
jgi:hypothetical protein